MQENKGNSLLELRSNAGTHDLAMGRATLERLMSAGEGEEVLPFLPALPARTCRA